MSQTNSNWVGRRERIVSLHCSPHDAKGKKEKETKKTTPSNITITYFDSFVITYLHYGKREANKSNKHTSSS
jgi:regulator of replication initiation timing